MSMIPGAGITDDSLEAAQVENYRNANAKAADGGGIVGKHKGDDPNWHAKTADGEWTLAAIKRRQREEVAEQLEESTQKRFKIVNFTSEDSIVVGDKSLFSYYCSICGEYSMTTDVELHTLPRRRTDGASVLDEAVHFHKKYLNFGEKLLIRRPNGVEKQYRFYCKQCRSPIGYRPGPANEVAKYSYIYKGGLVPEQSQAIAFQK
mmetsp:Transcript_61270/g.145873  ORF Transcript_61270/g.145873 Transcript_61270/m.145873 type:complete len:205 (-) Transcript_61270:113-727(-)|eukprot:CAMPEP_0178422336 /NCGR_PEP_ID=MMETSP0689_2-20121128/27120_1 /TAXON_ID=160604 /ORGANISM="Amphidinium massartii, Strain CS-259" /LENGTH=204 /DNA_ID=CAMNT_0020043895 /DNA_START=101 /DNA_END=715 /DNA_ORIENTATION=-